MSLRTSCLPMTPWSSAGTVSTSRSTWQPLNTRRDYGLQIHWGKVALGTVCTQTPVRDPSGQIIASKESMLYLGSTVHSGGKFGCEISRRVGSASSQFNALQRVLKNATLPKKRKIMIFDACIMSKLRYGVSSAWLSKSDLRRLGGFQAGCLRKMLGIAHSYYSRISNARVRQIAEQRPFSNQVRESQLKLLGQVLTNPDKHFLRSVAFHGCRDGRSHDETE